MYIGLKGRVYPNSRQKMFFDRKIESERFIYRYFENCFDESPDIASKSAIHWFYAERKKGDILYSTESELRNMVVHNYFLAKQNKQKSIDLPKKKIGNNSFIRRSFVIEDISSVSFYHDRKTTKIHLNEIGTLKVRGLQRKEGKIIRCYLSRDDKMRYFICFVMKVDSQAVFSPTIKKGCGVYLNGRGVFLSDGRFFPFPKKVLSKRKRIDSLRLRLSLKKDMDVDKTSMSQAELIRLFPEINDILHPFYLNIIHLLSMEYTFIGIYAEKVNPYYGLNWFLKHLKEKATRTKTPVVLVSDPRILAKRCHNCSYVSLDGKKENWTCPLCHEKNIWETSVCDNILMKAKDLYLQKGADTKKYP